MKRGKEDLVKSVDCTLALRDVRCNAPEEDGHFNGVRRVRLSVYRPSLPAGQASTFVYKSRCFEAWKGNP